MIRRLPAVLVAVAVVGLLGACGVDHGSPVGTWVHEDEGPTSGASLELHDDGTMTFIYVPAEIAETDAQVDGDGCVDLIAASTALRSGDGEWSDEGDFLYLHFDDGSVQGWRGDGTLEIRCDVESAGAYRFALQD